MKYLIVGLGNPGVEYSITRHNIGFQVVDYIAFENNLKFTTERYAHIAELGYKGNQLIIIKPQTYMNLSGKAVKYWLDKEKIEKENLLIILDDISLPFGVVRLKPKGNDGGHNGLIDIISRLGYNDFPRLRIGIGNDFPRGQQVEFVLGQWSINEMKYIPKILLLCSDIIKSFVTDKINLTMTKYNNINIIENNTK